MYHRFLSAFEYFVRTTPDADFHVSNLVLIVNVLMMAVIFAVVFRFRKASKRVFRIAILILLVLQVSIYTWYISNPNIGMIDGFPLYHCRIAILVLLISVLSKKYETKVCTYFTYMGFIGGVMALLVPEMDHYNFPHLTNFTFFIGHYCLFFISVYLLAHKKSSIKYREIAVATLVLHIIMEAVNMNYGTNYGFLRTPPGILGISAPPQVCFLVFTVLLTLGMFGMKLLHGLIIAKFDFESISDTDSGYRPYKSSWIL